MTAAETAPFVPFEGMRGRVLTWLLQRDSVRFHRVQRGFVEKPAQYERFLAAVVGPRVEALDGRLGVFGVGTHTEVLLKAFPSLQPRIHCFADNNPAVWRQVRFGHPVLPPGEAVKACDAFLLSTAVFQHVLRADLVRHGFKGPILAVDDVVPPAWFLVD